MNGSPYLPKAHKVCCENSASEVFSKSGLEDNLSFSERLWRKGKAQLAQDAAEALDERIEDEDLDGMADAVKAREALQRMQNLSPEISEELDANQTWHG